MALRAAVFDYYYLMLMNLAELSVKTTIFFVACSVLVVVVVVKKETRKLCFCQFFCLYR
jgi:hypothetical protein